MNKAEGYPPVYIALQLAIAGRKNKAKVVMNMKTKQVIDRIAKIKNEGLIAVKSNGECCELLDELENISISVGLFDKMNELMVKLSIWNGQELFDTLKELLDDDTNITDTVKHAKIISQFSDLKMIDKFVTLDIDNRIKNINGRAIIVIANFLEYHIQENGGLPSLDSEY